MNKDRRIALRLVLTALSEAKTQFEEAKAALETCKDEEREYYDNMPESLQNGDKGQTADAAATNLEEAFDALDELDFDDIINKIEEAIDG